LKKNLFTVGRCSSDEQGLSEENGKPLGKMNLDLSPKRVFLASPEKLEK
jgi:hypothetical protein